MSALKLLIFLLIIGLRPAISAADETYDAEVRYLYVQKGQTLHNIIRRLYPDQADKWHQLSLDIVKLNPHAFVDNDVAKMKADVRLTLPEKVLLVKPAQLKKVGLVDEVSGSVVAVDKSKVSRKLEAGSSVYLGDKVITGESGSVRLKMIDDAVLDLGCFSIMVIEKYALNTTNRSSIINLLQGSLNKVTGKIGKLADDIYELKTPVASVGVRGTEYALRVFQSKGCGGTIDADDGLYVEVIKGLVNVHNKVGSEVVAKGETAYVSLPKVAPKKVAIKPGILKPVEKIAIQPEPVAPEPVAPEPEEESSGAWWWLLGIVGLVLLI
ncbi:MAG: FecR domain-containing protein [Gammaproteobacteria bacterium]|nr:FecR domain-containing protein [Gammaproteobacteria bacterium]